MTFRRTIYHLTQTVEQNLACKHSRMYFGTVSPDYIANRNEGLGHILTHYPQYQTKTVYTNLSKVQKW